MIASSLALGLASLALGHPNPRQSDAARGINIANFEYSTPSVYSNSDETRDNVLASSIQPGESYTNTAENFAKSMFPALTYRLVDDHYVGDNGMGHVYLKQTHHGLDVDNADFNINVGSDGKIFSYGHNFFTGATPASDPSIIQDYVSPLAALQGVVKVLGLPISVNPDASSAKSVAGDERHFTISGTQGTVSDPDARLVYFASGDRLSLAWRVEMDVDSSWLVSYVDAYDVAKVHGAMDYVSDATIQVLDWKTADPSEPGDRKILTDPWVIKSSPLGWFSDGKTNYTTTWGNNAVAQNNPKGGSEWRNNYRPKSSEMKFEFPWTKTAEPKNIVDASITQLFYTSNMIHDQYYLLGFTEKAGNFQFNNFGKGGKEGDGVQLNAQDGGGTNNANFGTPPDGAMPRMNMYLWTKSNPYRDCSFDQAVVIHEYVHGLSTRLTGGPGNSGCLRSGESGGMGEGWSDTFAFLNYIMKKHDNTLKFPMGHWIFNNPGGIRKFPYSLDKKVNPMTYKTGDESDQVHFLGTVWATILYDITWAMIGKHGITDDDMPSFDEKGVPKGDGRFMMMKLLIDGMSIQPCSPSFIQARDAIIDADKALTGGDNKCLLWKGFAGRGLGPNAKGGKSRVEDFTPPSGC